MARISWHNSKSRTNNDKSNSIKPQDWFSIGTGEPSRQAFADLVRRRDCDRSTSSKHGHGSSRSSTSSTATKHRRTPSLDRTRPPTSFRQHGRPETPTRTLLDRGAQIIRRTGSRMSMSSTGSASASGPSGHIRSNQSLSGMTPDGLRAFISRPFDFQHITHTEKAQVQNFVSPESTATTPDIPLHANVLPPSPPPPAPLAKDSPPQLPLPYHDLPRIPSFSTVAIQSLQSSVDDRLDKPLPIPRLGEALHDATPAAAKPLPTLPVIHAVSTEDDSARPLMTSPLPTPPPLKTTFDDQLASFPHTHIIREFHRPTNKSSIPSLLSVNNCHTSDRALPHNQSEVALPRKAEAPTEVSSRVIMSLSVIDTMDWEEAIDEAWDNAADQDDTWTDPTSSLSSWQSSPIDVHHSSSTADTSVASTPLMTSTSFKSEQRQSGEMLKAVAYSPCTGLGIRNRGLVDVRNDAEMVEEDDCPISRTTSHASLIPSLNSSLNGADRSSKSSIATTGLLPSTDNSVDERSSLQRARPDSGCLPVDILAEMVDGSPFTKVSKTGYHDEVTRRRLPTPQQRRSSFLRRLPVTTPKDGTVNRKRANTYHLFAPHPTHTFCATPSSSALPGVTPV